MDKREGLIIGLPAQTVIKTSLITPEIFEEIMKLPVEKGEHINIPPRRE